MRVLLTGGTGFVGSHTAVVLAAAGHTVVLYDSLVNSKREVANNISAITATPVVFVEGDIRDSALLGSALRKYAIDTVIHFAALKAVGESVNQPLRYYDNNITGTLSLLQAMLESNVDLLVFSSSATVYGEPRYLPIDEAHATSATNPYGRTKLHIEEILQDLARANPAMRATALRYFNPVGAHPSGLIGEDPSGIPSNLTPYIAKVINGQLPYVPVYGNDYTTPDGTAIRDYIHVMDVAEAHSAALVYLQHTNDSFTCVNLGTGRGYSVMEMINTFSQVSGQSISYQIKPRRAGDVVACYADTQKAKKLLGWQARYGITEMCSSLVQFQKNLRS